MPEAADLVERLEARATPFERTVLVAARAWCEAQAAGLYAVGGTVRDLLLGRAHLDLDLVVDGDVTALASSLAASFSAALTMHTHFGTATLTAAEGSLDLARSRRETYAYTGALPRVEAAPIAQDLGRRDFSINAMALGLAGAERGRLIDPFAGAADLAAQRVRVLHDESFRDDPTRILRLARYAARLGFEVETETRALARRDATFLAAVSPARVSHELERTFAEQRPEGALALLQELRALPAIYPPFLLPVNLNERCARLRADGGAPPGTAEYLCAIVAAWPRTRIEGLADTLEPRHEVRGALRDVCRAATTLASLAGSGADPAEIVTALGSLHSAAVRGAGAAAGAGEALLVRRYLCEWRNVRPHLRGNDAIALGVREGPAVGAVLQRLRAGRLRGEIQSEDDERRLVRDWLAAPREGRDDGDGG